MKKVNLGAQLVRDAGATPSGRTGRLMRKGLVTLCAATFLLQPMAAIAEERTTYTYDEVRPGAKNIGALTSVANEAGTIRYDHDAHGNVTSRRWEVDGATYEQTFTYAPDGKVLRKGYADGTMIPSATGTIQYDALGNTKSIPGLINNITYNAAQQPVTTTYANGVTETRTYDPNRQWLTSIETKSGATTIFSESYTRNNKGLITQVTSNRANGDWKYGYDTANRLTTATNLNNADYTQTFRYDAADNVTYNSQIGSYTYPAPTAPRPHAVTQAGNRTYQYDLNGNMTDRNGQAIVYDGEDRPVSVTTNGVVTTFVYGPDGKRLKKITGSEVTLYLGADEEITSEGVHIKHPIADVRIAGTAKNWMHRDHLSSVRLMSDASGTIVSEEAYKAYGKRETLQTALGLPRESKGYIGERDDPETGLQYLNARYYDPELARFISPDWFDPKKPGVGTNRYAYGLNNPIWLKDPSGNEVTTVTVIVSIASLIAAIFTADAVTDNLDNGKIDGSAGPGLNHSASQGLQAGAGYVADSIFANENNEENGAERGGWSVPPEVVDKVPSEWGEGKPNRKKPGWRWQDPESQDGVRVDEGNPDAEHPSQQEDHVIVNSGGKVIGRDGEPINGSIKDDPENAHIPLSEYEKWKYWNAP